MATWIKERDDLSARCQTRFSGSVSPGGAMRRVTCLVNETPGGEASPLLPRQQHKQQQQTTQIPLDISMGPLSEAGAVASSQLLVIIVHLDGICRQQLEVIPYLR